MARRVAVPLIAFLLCGAKAVAQLPAPPAVPAPAPAAASGCDRCHVCDLPTAEDRCLRDPCTRHLRRKPPGDSGPDVVVLSRLERDFLPVRFDHKGHSRMADMGDGCVTCHHFTSALERPPPCVSCHDAAVAGTDPRKPGLKGAYHQQCLNCHREWVDETDCEVCHLAKPAPGSVVRTPAFPASDVTVPKAHPPILKPQGDLYRGDSPDRDSRVVFRHDQHVDRFGLTCVECHHEPSCARCHNREGCPPARRTVQEHHRPCVQCHKNDMDLVARDAGRCEQCHWLADTPEPPPFDHASTGWALGRFHEKLLCRDCHAAVPFQRLDKRCESCHKAWSPANFRHAITGRPLDETHAALDCENCHRERRFDQPAACDECHDEKGKKFPPP